MAGTLLVLTGPTGVGKTELSLQLAEHYGCPIVSADSRQFYRDIPIGTAAPTASELARVKHYFVGQLALTDYYSASCYEEEVLRLLDTLFQTHEYVLLTGGSMMYIDAVCKGIDEIPTITDEVPAYTFQLGKGSVLRDGSDVTVIATGMMVQMAYAAAQTLEGEGISVRVIDMHTIKPLDHELVLKAALETRCIVTSEEHTVIGGLGAAVAEFLSEHCPVPVVRHGVNDEFGHSGEAKAVLKAYGLTPEGIADKVRQAMKLKK